MTKAKQGLRRRANANRGRKEIKKAVQIGAVIMAYDFAATGHAQTNTVPTAGSGTNTVPTAASGTNAAPQQLPDVVVSGEKESYKSDSVALPKITEPLRDVPQSITVVPRDVMNDQNSTTLREVLRNVAGISIAAGEGGSQGDNLTLRGFTARNDIFLDGMRDYGSYYRDTFNYEAVDVLAGPESVMFGRGSTGGIVNQESKTPEARTFAEGSLVFGTDLTRRGTLDVNTKAPVLGDNTAVRLNVMGHESDVAGRNVTENSRFGFAPSITFGLGTPTRFTLAYLHQSENDIPDYGVPWNTNGAPVNNIARQNFYGFRDDFLKTDVDIVTARVEHEFSDAISLRDQLRYANYERDFRITEPKLNPADESVTRNMLGGRSTETFLWDQLDLTAKFDTGFIEHTLVGGLEGGRETSDPTRFGFTNVPPTSLFSPNENENFSGGATNRSIVQTTATSFGVYLLDTIKFGKHWELSGGVRWDYFDADYKAAAIGATPATSFHQQVSKASWRGALVFKPVEIGSIYFDYGTSWNPSAETLSLSAGTANTPPEENETFEIGTKWDLLEKRLSVRASIFRTEKTNAREPDPNDATLNVLGGGQRVDGIELAVSGAITEKWRVFASYDYLDGRVVSSQFYTNAIGKPLNNVPYNTFSFWSTYELPWNLEVGGGINVVSRRYANSATRTQTTVVESVDGYWTLNAMLKYTLNKHVSFQANIYNLTDNLYYDQLHPAHVIPAAGISALFSANFKF